MICVESEARSEVSSEARSEAMYDYTKLPTLVLNEIFGYLSVKQRLRCRWVCRAWKEEIELREAQSDTLVLNVGPYLWNVRWSQTNNRSLMRFENSFELTATSLVRPVCRWLVWKTRKLAVVCSLFQVHQPELTQLFFNCLKNCVEVEIRSFNLKGTLTFDLPYLKALVINDSPIDQLVLNCPSLELLSWNGRAAEINLQNVANLKRLIAFAWPVKFSFDGNFEHLEYLSLFLPNEALIGNRLLHRMPALKRLVIYSSNQRTDLVRVRRQAKRFGLKNLEVLFNGFREPVKIEYHDEFMQIDQSVDELFANYSNLVENPPWKVCIDYSKLFSKFKILPSNFFERFNEPFSIHISEVTNYMHLYEFLKCYPCVHRLVIHFSKIKADRILDLVHLLQDSLKDLVIVEKRPSDVRKIDLSFMRRLSLFAISLECTRLPAHFIRTVAAQRSSQLRAIYYQELITGHRLVVYFPKDEFYLNDFTCDSDNLKFSTIEQLISFMQSHPHLSEFSY